MGCEQEGLVIAIIGRFLVTAVLATAVCVVARAADDPAAKALATKIKTELRAVENAGDPATVANRLAAAEEMLIELRATSPNHSELAVIETRFRRSAGRPAGATAKAAPAAPAAVDAEAKQQTIRDWTAMVALYKDFDSRLRPVIPHGESVIYDPANIEPVIATITKLRAETPVLREKLKEFAAKYGDNTDAIDRKLFELTPDNPKKSRLDPENQRPDGSAGQAYENLLSRMTDLQNAPPQAARIELNNAITGIDTIRTFVLDTERDRQWAEVEKRIAVAARLNPDDGEIRAWQTKIGQIRKETAADAQKAVSSTKMSPHLKDFSGPGSPDSLAKATIAYFNKAYPKEKALVATVAGDWVVTKRNILGEPIQWGLPVHVASEQGSDKSVVRVFRMTVLANEGRDPKKEPPFVDHWTGDSYRMLRANLP